MNGIIHMCSHPDDNNPHFRITEERIFKDIFHYIEVLFRMIRPQKLFFMAVDGVAPRAKMNQQRGRRFRSAKEADKMEAEALKKGKSCPLRLDSTQTVLHRVPNLWLDYMNNFNILSMKKFRMIFYGKNVQWFYLDTK